jgi:tripartite-type tricarboxylate transporter receptor subunit TctC
MAAKASEILFRSLKTIIDQKVELGLLQPQAKERFPEKRFKEIRAVLAIAMPLASPRAKRWQNLKDVLAQCPDGAPDVVFISGKGNEAIDIPGFKNAPWIYV